LVSVSQCGTMNRLAQTHVIELGRLSRQADLYISQALSIGYLSKGHHAKLRRARQRPDCPIAMISRNDTVEGTPRQQVHQLREERLAIAHTWALPAPIVGETPESQLYPPQQRTTEIHYLSIGSWQCRLSEPDSSDNEHLRRDRLGHQGACVGGVRPNHPS